MSRTVSRSRRGLIAALSIALAASIAQPALADGIAPQSSENDNGSVW